MEGTLSKNQVGKGILITFEGIDGSGKSTQIKRLKNFFKKNNIKNVIFNREPGGSALGKKVKNLLINNNNNILSQEVQILLLIAARYEHYEKLILPLLKKDGLPEIAHQIIADLQWDYNVTYDEKDAVGRRYRRQDAAGTPFCITVDHQTKEDNTVTIRNRDTMQQERILISEISEKIKNSISYKEWLGK